MGMLRAFITVFLFAFASVPAWSQVATGGIRGIVTDRTGAVVVGAVVKLTNTMTRAERTVKVGTTGDYEFNILPPGEYAITAELAGFRTVRLDNVRVRVNEITRVDIVLQPGQVTEVVEVTGMPPTLRTENAELGGVVDHVEIVNLPLNGRNFIQLVSLEPGASATVKTRAGNTSFVTTIGGGQYSVHGMPANATEFLFDGMSMRDIIAPQVGIRPTVDAVQEFNFQASNYSAAFGGTAGGLVNITSRSGSNRFHGSAWEFLRNEFFDARNYFQTESALFRRHQFGGTFGGPIIRDKTFFFFSYEGLRRRKGISRAVTVPTLLQRAGDFSEGAPIYNPLDVDPITGERQPFPNNQIPSTLWSPQGVAVLEMEYPKPNLPGTANNLTGTELETNDSDQYGIRVDHRITQKDLLFFRYTHQDFDNDLPWGTFISYPNFRIFWNNPAKNSVVGYTRVINSTTVNEFRVGYNWFHNTIQDAEQGRNVNQELGISGLSNDPRLLGHPIFLVSGLARTAGLANVPNIRNNHTYKIWDNLNLVRGRHSLSMGANALWYRQNGGHNSNARGSFSFDGSFTSQLASDGTRIPGTGNPIADLLLGFPRIASRCCFVGDGFRHFRRSDWGLYVQDDWKLSSKLTVNLGLRYDYYGVAYETDNLISVPDLSQAPSAVLLLAGENGVSRGLRSADRNNFSPRVGFAYMLGASGRTVIRGGYGIFYNSQSNYVWLMHSNPPFTDNVTVVSSSTTPELNLSNPFSGGAQIPAFNFSSVASDYRDPYSENWNLNIEHESWGIVFSAAYVGNHGVKLIEFFNLNRPEPGPGALNPRRPIPAYGSITIAGNFAGSNYDALEVKARKAASKSLTFLASYVRARCLDTGGGNVFGDGSGSAGRDFRNPSLDKGPCDYDHLNRGTISFVHNLSFGRGLSNVWARRLVSNWSWQGIISIEDGQPFTPLLGFDNSNTGGFRDHADLVPGQDPNDGPRTVQQWVNVDAFSLPDPFTYGTAGRNSLRGPGFATVDLSVGREFTLAEGHTLRFRAEAFNLFNHPNFLQPIDVFGTPVFGVITGALDPRELQFSLKYSF